MILNETVPVAWNPRNKKMYESLGYEYTKMGDYIQVKVEDLPPSSKAVLDVKCDVCGKVMRRRVPDYINCHSEEFGDTCLDCCQSKRESTNIEVYGNKCTALNPDVKRKQIETQKKNNGGVLYFQTEEFKERSKQTCLDKYGCEFPMQYKPIMDRAKATNVEKYGTTCPLHNEEIKAKYQAERMEKHGVIHNMQIPEVREKAMQTLSENGNVPTSSQQLKIYDMLCSEYDIVEINKPVSKISLDVYVCYDGHDIDIEYDGTYWHKGKEQYDRKRDEFIKSMGYKVLRISSRRSVPDMTQIKDAIDYLVKGNHSFTRIDMND